MKENVLPPQTGKRRSLDHRVPAVVVPLLSLPVKPIDGRSFFAAIMQLRCMCAAAKEKVLPPQTGKQWTLDHRVPVVVVPLLSLPVMPIDGR